MLRTSRQSNYWGLVQQRGPWEETAIDKQRLKNTKIINIGGGVSDGGTVHAGHSQWNTQITPYPQYSILPPVPNPSTYAQIGNVIPGPPQPPLAPGRPPAKQRYNSRYYTSKGLIHQDIFPPDISESNPSQSDITYFDPQEQELNEAATRRDLYTGPLGHTYDGIDDSSLYYEGNDYSLANAETQTTNLAINAQAPYYGIQEQRTSYTTHPQTIPGPRLSYSQIVTNSITPDEHNRTITLSTGETLTVPSLTQAYNYETFAHGPQPPSTTQTLMYPVDPDFILTVHNQILALSAYLDETLEDYLSNQSPETENFKDRVLIQNLSPIDQFLQLVDIDTTHTKEFITQSRRAGLTPSQYAELLYKTINDQFENIYTKLPIIPSTYDSDIVGLPPPQSNSTPIPTTRILVQNPRSLTQINHQLSNGLRNHVEEHIIPTPISGVLSSGEKPLGQQLINSVGSVSTSFQKLVQAASLDTVPPKIDLTPHLKRKLPRNKYGGITGQI